MIRYRDILVGDTPCDPSELRARSRILQTILPDAAVYHLRGLRIIKKTDSVFAISNVNRLKLDDRLDGINGEALYSEDYRKSRSQQASRAGREVFPRGVQSETFLAHRRRAASEECPTRGARACCRENEEILHRSIRRCGTECHRR